MADMSWPRDLLPTGAVSILSKNGRILGPVSLAGTRQTQVGQAGHWEIGYSNLPRYSPAQNRVWRAIATRLQAGETIRVPAFDDYQRPSAGTAPVILPHSDDTYFADGAGYVSGPVSATVSGALTVNTRTAVIDVAGGGPITAGHYFSIVHPTWDERLYMIDRVSDVAGSVCTVGFWPPLREAVADGVDLNFNDPRCVCQLSSDEVMADDRVAEVLTRNSVKFVEAFP